jgi:hypothetical protein
MEADPDDLIDISFTVPFTWYQKFLKKSEKLGIDQNDLLRQIFYDFMD